MIQNVLNSSAGTVVAERPADFMQVSRARATQERITLTEAMRRTEREQPELHREFLIKANKANFERKTSHRGRGNSEFLAVSRARAKRKGISLANAMSEVAHEFPWLYTGDIPKQSTTTSQAQTPQVAQASSQIQSASGEEDNGDDQDKACSPAGANSAGKAVKAEVQPTVSMLPAKGPSVFRQAYLGNLPIIKISNSGAIC
jgi:hypothetical protein